jgi:hypothetical protein
LLSFIYRHRLFGNPVRLDYYLGFMFEVILVLSLWGIVVDLDDLAGFAAHLPVVVTSPSVFYLLSGVGVYGVRVSMYIAIIRRNRSPQPAEWVVTLLGLGLAFFFMLFGGSVLNGWAALHGYDRCLSRGADAVFVPYGASCPAR